MRLDDRSVLLTGATGGIGGAIARELAARGCVLTLTGRREAELSRLVAELGPPTRGFTADLCEPKETRELLARSGPVDVLVSNAGVGTAEALADMSEAALEQAMRVNLLSAAGLARATLPAMRKRGAGHIVFISSVAGLVATAANSAVYTATKWGLRGLALALAEELHGSGVSVSTIFPGAIRDAGMTARLGLPAPRGTGTSSPLEVAIAVAEAIEHERSEVVVATPAVRMGAALAGAAPSLVARLARLGGATRAREAVRCAEAAEHVDAHADDRGGGGNS